MELAGMVRGVSRLKILFLLILLLWMTVTVLDFYSADFRGTVPFPTQKVSLNKDRQLLISTITDSVEEDYEDVSEGNESLPESLNIPGVSISKQSFSENDQTQSYTGDSDFESWMSQQSELKENVRKVCDKYGKSLNGPVPLNQFMYDSKHNLLFCRNAKVGTTTWLTHFLELSGKKNTMLEEFGTNYSKMLHRTVPGLFRIGSLHNTSIKSLANHSTSFSMVRHPFERLVSAFQDKIVDNSDPFYERVVDHIINNYGEINFENFVHMIIKKSKTRCRRLNKCGLDKHWKPFISRCGYCDIPYKVIAKAENFAQDQKFIGKLGNIDFKTVATHVSSGGSTKELAKKYFSQLSLDTVKKLFSIYKVDFEMFGYSPQLYYDYARNGAEV